MLKTGDELRASALERTRRSRAKQAEIKKKQEERVVQFIVTIWLPKISITKMSRTSFNQESHSNIFLENIVQKK
jgi:hypothetical protein